MAVDRAQTAHQTAQFGRFERLDEREHLDPDRGQPLYGELRVGVVRGGDDHAAARSAGLFEVVADHRWSCRLPRTS